DGILPVGYPVYLDHPLLPDDVVGASDVREGPLVDKFVGYRALQDQLALGGNHRVIRPTLHEGHLLERVRYLQLALPYLARDSSGEEEGGMVADGDSHFAVSS